MPIIEDIVSRRSYIPKVSDTQMLASLKTVLEEIADDFETDEEGWVKHYRRVLLKY